MSEDVLPFKRDVANRLLRKGSLFVHFDPRINDVVVPPWLRHQAQLVLQVGLDMPIPIPDLRVDENGIFGTLSFSLTPFTCNVPWGAVFALVGDEGRGMVWPESMPAEIVAEVERETRRSQLAEATRENPPVTVLKDRDFDKLPWPSRIEPKGESKGKPNGPKVQPRGSRKKVRELPPYLRIIK